MYRVLDRGNDTSDADTTVTQMAAAATTGSTLGNTYQATAIPPELIAAINMIAANQQPLYQHIAPLFTTDGSVVFPRAAAHAGTPASVTRPTHPASSHPWSSCIWRQSWRVPAGVPARPGWWPRTRRHGNRCNNNRCGHGHTPFADHMAAQSRGYGGGTGAFPPYRGRHSATFPV